MKKISCLVILLTSSYWTKKILLESTTFSLHHSFQTLRPTIDRGTNVIHRQSMPLLGQIFFRDPRIPRTVPGNPGIPEIPESQKSRKSWKSRNPRNPGIPESQKSQNCADPSSRHDGVHCTCDKNSHMYWLLFAGVQMKVPEKTYASPCIRCTLFLLA